MFFYFKKNVRTEQRYSDNTKAPGIAPRRLFGMCVEKISRNRLLPTDDYKTKCGWTWRVKRYSEVPLFTQQSKHSKFSVYSAYRL